VELYARVRRAVQVEGTSEREAARQFGISRETVRKMLRYSIPPGYQRKRPIRRPKLEAWTGIIDQILEDDKGRPAKQRHSALRIFERLRDEYAFAGCYTIVKHYVRQQKLTSAEMFVPAEGKSELATRVRPGSFWENDRSDDSSALVVSLVRE
jgi:transposase